MKVTGPGPSARRGDVLAVSSFLVAVSRSVAKQAPGDGKNAASLKQKKQAGRAITNKMSLPNVGFCTDHMSRICTTFMPCRPAGWPALRLGVLVASSSALRVGQKHVPG